MPLLTLSKTPLLSHPRPYVSTALPVQLPHARLSCTFKTGLRRLNRFRSVSLTTATDFRTDCLRGSTALFASGGPDGSGGDAAAAEDVSDKIVLDVEGMICGGCSASVKRILEGQPEVSSANVDHSTKTAIILPVPEAMVEPNWQQHLGEALAKHVTSCGFESKLRE